MSLSPPDVILDRICTATPESRIAVYRSSRKGLLDAAFADTSGGLKRIRTDPRLVGVFDRTSKADVLAILMAAA